MRRNGSSERKRAVMTAAAERWEAKGKALAETAIRLARGGPRAAATPAHAIAFESREAAKRISPYFRVGFERLIGDTNDLEDSPPTELARAAGRPVARIVDLVDAAKIGDGFATGFLVAPDLLVTNWHVFDSPEDAVMTGAQFGFERNAAGLIESGVVFEIDPSRFFLSDPSVDIAIVGLKPQALIGSGSISEFGRVRLIPTVGKILVGHPVSIIQHPDGRQKHWAYRHSKLLLDPTDADLFLDYSTDTLPGSSGSPAFNIDWELVAVHHSGVPRRVNNQIVTKSGEVWRPGIPEEAIDWVGNEGARVSKIYETLHQKQMSDPVQQALLDQLLAGSTDPLLEGSGRVINRPTIPEPMSARAAYNQVGGSVNIVVNGTANFYFQPEPNRSADAPDKPRVEPLPTVPGAVEKKIKFDSDYDSRPGYDSAFLDGFDVPMPTAPLDEVHKDGASQWVLPYHHYSLVMHKKRRLCMWTASNADYDEKKRWRTREEFGEDTWKADPRIANKYQVEDAELYDPAKKFDRGHIVRRDDVAWGETKQEEEYGNSDSFHWTNCTPQHEQFNRDIYNYHGLWGGLENQISHEAGFVDNRLIIFAGPVLSESDPKRDFGSGAMVQVPVAFWKVVVVIETSGETRTLRAYGFVLDQTEAINQYGWEGRFRAGKFKEQQVSLATITELSRVKFGDALYAADPLANDPHEGKGRALRTMSDIKLR